MLDDVMSRMELNTLKCSDIVTLNGSLFLTFLSNISLDLTIKSNKISRH